MEGRFMPICFRFEGRFNRTYGTTDHLIGFCGNSRWPSWKRLTCFARPTGGVVFLGIAENYRTGFPKPQISLDNRGHYLGFGSFGLFVAFHQYPEVWREQGRTKRGVYWGFGRFIGWSLGRFARSVGRCVFRGNHSKTYRSKKGREGSFGFLCWVFNEYGVKIDLVRTFGMVVYSSSVPLKEGFWELNLD